MKLLKPGRTIIRNGRTYVLGRAALTGRSEGPPEGGDGGAGGGEPNGGEGEKGKTFTQEQLNKFLAKEKQQGKAAGKAEAEQALADTLGVSIEEAKAIIAKNKEAEDSKKSEADKDREKAAKVLADAEKAKADAQVETHAARIERALAASGFVTDDTDEGKKKSSRVQRLVTAEVGASYDDVLADVQSVKSDFPELFGSKTEGDDGKKAKGKLPNSDPAGKPKAPNGGEDKFAAGQKRFEENAAKNRGYNPFEKQKA
jgi:hypothetical protein